MNTLGNMLCLKAELFKLSGPKYPIFSPLTTKLQYLRSKSSSVSRIKLLFTPKIDVIKPSFNDPESQNEIVCPVKRRP